MKNLRTILYRLRFNQDIFEISFLIPGCLRMKAAALNLIRLDSWEVYVGFIIRNIIKVSYR